MGNWFSDLGRDFQIGISNIEEQISEWSGDDKQAAEDRKHQAYLDQKNHPDKRPSYLKYYDPERYKQEYPELWERDQRIAQGIEEPESSGDNMADTTTGDTTDTPSDTSVEGGEAFQIDYAELMRLQEQAASRASAYNRRLAGELVGETMDQTVSTASALDEALQREMDRLYPGLRTSTMSASQEALEATRKAAAEFSTGMVPQDVQDYQRKLASELGIQRGVFGSARDYGLARNLGLSSLQMKQQGIAMYGTLPSMSAQILQNARSLSPAMNQLPQMYDAMYARQFAASAMPTGAFMGSIASAMGQNTNLAQEQSQFNTSLDWAQRLSQMQQDMERQRMQLELDAQRRGQKVAEQSNYWNLAGSIVGALGSYYGYQNRSGNNGNNDNGLGFGNRDGTPVINYTYNFGGSNDVGDISGGTSGLGGYSDRDTGYYDWMSSGTTGWDDTGWGDSGTDSWGSGYYGE